MIKTKTSLIANEQQKKKKQIIILCFLDNTFNCSDI